MPDICGFCGAPETTKEHVWGDWARKVILEARAEDAQKHFRFEKEVRGETKFGKGSNLGITIRMPCASCNNGWMSKLEQDVLPFMPRMLRYGESVSLGQSEQRALARWAMKTAMVYEYLDHRGDVKYFSDLERRSFKDQLEIPENVWIWVGRYDGLKPMHAVQTRAEADAGTRPAIYSFTLGANFLVVQVFAYRQSAGDLSPLALSTKKDYLSQIWPIVAADQTWPPSKTIDDHGLAVLDSRFEQNIKELQRRRPQ